MAKKFGKFLLFTAAAGAAAAGVYYYLKNKEMLEAQYDLDDDEDYDDFSDDLDDAESTARSYVPLNGKENSVQEEAGASEALATPEEEPIPEDTAKYDGEFDSLGGDGDFASLAEKAKEATEGKVEEFFDEDDL